MVKRYSVHPELYDAGMSTMVESKQGEWVDYTDYAESRAEVDRLKSSNDMLGHIVAVAGSREHYVDQVSKIKADAIKGMIDYISSINNVKDYDDVMDLMLTYESEFICNNEVE